MSLRVIPSNIILSLICLVKLNKSYRHSKAFYDEELDCALIKMCARAKAEGGAQAEGVNLAPKPPLRFELRTSTFSA